MARRKLFLQARPRHAPCASRGRHRAVRSPRSEGMAHTWLPGEPGDEELESLFAATRETWRGALHRDAEAGRPESGEEVWRGTAPLAEWPASAAGPLDRVYTR